MESITESNKLIAEFMGLSIITDNISYFDTNYKPLKNYNKDWNCLMEVVDKIESFDFIIGFEIQDNCATIKIFRELSDYFYTVGATKIDATYKSVIEFIKWHNTNKYER